MSDPAHSTPFLTIGGFTPPKPTTGTIRQPAFGTMSGESSRKAPTERPYNPEDEHQDIKPKTERESPNPGNSGTTGKPNNPLDPPPSDSGDDSEAEREKRRKRNKNRRSKNAPRSEKKAGKERKERPIPKLDKLEGANDFQSWSNSIKKYLQMCEVEGKYRYSFWDHRQKNSRALCARRAYNELLQNLALYAELDLPSAT